MRPSRIKKITGTIIKHYFTGKYLLWCECFAPYSAKDPESNYMQMLATDGYTHEDGVIEKRYPGLEELELEFDEVLPELKKGHEAFSNLSLVYQKFSGKPDLLVRKEGKSDLGDFYYVVKEIKSAKNMKTKHIMQSAFYNYLIGKIQGYTPEKFYLINKENEEFEYSYSDYKQNLTHAIKDIKQIFRGGIVPPSVGTSYPWKNYAIKNAQETNDITLIQGVTENNRHLFPQTIRAIANSQSLTDIIGIGNLKSASIKNSAQAILAKKEIVLKKPKFEKNQAIYFDLETASTDEKLGLTKPINYLFGLLINDKFIPIRANNLNEKSEKEAFKKFIAKVSKYENYTIYVYSGYESRELTRMFKEYDIDDKISSNIRDLHKDLKASLQLPTLNNGLKSVAKYYGFKWREQIRGQDSIALYLRYLKTKDEKLLQQILDYNEDDVRATQIVKEALEKL